jgi:hypothetical protein
MSTPLTPEQVRLRSQLANATRWSRVPRAERPSQTQAARDALWAKYLARVDPEGVLPEDERQALARQARRADMLAMSLKSSRNSGKRRKGGASDGAA